MIVACFCYFLFFEIFFLFFFAQEYVAACCLDARDEPGLPGIPPIEHDKAWVIVEELCVKVINEVRGAEDAHNHYHTDDGYLRFHVHRCGFAHHAASPDER